MHPDPRRTLCSGDLLADRARHLRNLCAIHPFTWAIRFPAPLRLLRVRRDARRLRARYGARSSRVGEDRNHQLRRHRCVRRASSRRVPVQRPPRHRARRGAWKRDAAPYPRRVLARGLSESSERRRWTGARVVLVPRSALASAAARTRERPLDAVPGLADDPLQGSAGDVSFDALGAHWLRRTIGSRSGLQRTWINWRTAEQRADASGPRVVPDPDLAQLYVVPCEGMELPNPLPRAYQMPYGLVSTDRLRVRRCGETASLPVDPAGWGDAARLGGGIVSWGTSAHLIACRVGLSWRSDTARKLVHAGRTLVLTHLPPRRPEPGDVSRLVLPAGCPPGPAAQSLAVRVAGDRTTRLRPDAASWQTSAAWGEARARVLPGTFPVRRLALARGARVAVSMPSATAVRFAVNRGGWRLALLLHGGEWHFALPARSVARQLRIAVRFADGVATYRARRPSPR